MRTFDGSDADAKDSFTFLVLPETGFSHGARIAKAVIFEFGMPLHSPIDLTIVAFVLAMIVNRMEHPGSKTIAIWYWQYRSNPARRWSPKTRPSTLHRHPSTNLGSDTPVHVTNHEIKIC